MFIFSCINQNIATTLSGINQDIFDQDILRPLNQSSDFCPPLMPEWSFGSERSATGSLDRYLSMQQLHGGWIGEGEVLDLVPKRIEPAKVLAIWLVLQHLPQKRLVAHCHVPRHDPVTFNPGDQWVTQMSECLSDIVSYGNDCHDLILTSSILLKRERKRH